MRRRVLYKICKRVYFARRREFRWFGLLLKVIDTVTLSIIKFSILILAQIVENRESRQTGQIAGPRLPAVLYEDLFSS